MSKASRGKTKLVARGSPKIAPLALTVGLHEDVLLIAVGEKMRDHLTSLLDGPLGRELAKRQQDIAILLQTWRPIV